MKKEDKELLLKDLCARLPYGVKMNHIADTESNPITLVGIAKTMITLESSAGYGTSDIEDYIPYLFPISSMTEEQKKEYYSLAEDVTIKPGQGCYLGIKIHCIKLGISDNPHEEVWDYVNLDALDWLNKNHFDYRGLIEKGLATDATGLNIY